MGRKIEKLKFSEFSLGEEISHAITHGIGAALGVAALCILVVLATDAWRVVSFSIYGGSVILLYLSSTFYHSFTNPRVKKIFRVIDHSAIYLLIAGTYTPFLLVSIRGPWGWTMFGLIWGIAIFGILYKIFFMGRFPIIATLGYIGMGLLIMLATKPLIEAVSVKGLLWLCAGGASYILGVAFYAWKKLPYNHMIFHLFVLGGSICHFFSILFYVLPT